MDLSVVIPTYSESQGIARIVESVNSEFSNHGIKGEIIIVDDNSPDGTGDIAERLKVSHTNLEVIHRKGKQGLSSAVLEGFFAAKADVLGVMDADFSHPPEKIHEMLEAIRRGADIAIGSRYVEGGGIEGWGLYRKLQSKGAIILSRPFTSAKDAMSGFFMVRRECIEGRKLDPQGFKILLEILVKADYKRVEEVPIKFVNRKAGKSKMGSGEIFSYLRNLANYALHARRLRREFLQFALVGLVGTMINILILYSLTDFLGVYYIISAVMAFCAAVISNFILNKKFTFKERISHKAASKFAKFTTISVAGLAVNLALLYALTEFGGIYYLISQIIAIALAFEVNFLGNKVWTFSG